MASHMVEELESRASGGDAGAQLALARQYLADGARYDFEFDFMPGEALQAFVVEVGSLPADQRARIRRVLMP